MHVRTTRLQIMLSNSIFYISMIFQSFVLTHEENNHFI
jgi:hypothetical protein